MSPVIFLSCLKAILAWKAMCILQLFSRAAFNYYMSKVNTHIINKLLKLQHKKCFLRIIIHSLQNAGTRTRLPRSLVRFQSFATRE